MSKNRYRRCNPKRSIAPAGTFADHDLAKMVKTVEYTGKSDHERNRGDFGLTPPAGPRPGKTLCDTAEILRKEQALALLKKGLKLGTIGKPDKNGWPRRIWAVANNDAVLEAQMDAAGSYHGYPLAPRDPFANEVVKIWKGSQ